jgi:hypothetical protein
LRIFNTTEGKIVVSDSEVLVMFVTVDGESTTRSISDWHKVSYRRAAGKGNKTEKVEKLILSYI